MSPELSKALKEKYPGVLANMGNPYYGGLDVGDGWYWLIDKLCTYLTFGDKQRGRPVVAQQIKEKFGGLRFYVGSATDKDFEAIGLVEHMSYSMCEECGTTKDVTTEGRWIRTLCKSCRGAPT